MNNNITKSDETFMHEAYLEALKGYNEGGIPVGAVMVRSGKIIARGHNRRVQDGNPISHGETDCIKKAGRQKSYHDITLYTTLSPCIMCAGTIALFKMKRVVIGENKNFGGNEKFLEKRGIEVSLMKNQDCISLMSKFIKEKPELWNEDIAVE
ncbi:nucleoside deaminase [Pseudomonadota bacterium]